MKIRVNMPEIACLGLASEPNLACPRSLGAKASSERGLAGGRPRQERAAKHAVEHVLQPDLRAGAMQADASNALAAQFVLHAHEHVRHAGANLGAALVLAPLVRCQLPALGTRERHPRLDLRGAKRLFFLFRPIRRVRVQRQAALRRVDQILQHGDGPWQAPSVHAHDADDAGRAAVRPHR